MIRGIDHVAITVADLDAACRFYERALDARRSADGLPATSIYFHDPDGNLIELLAT